MREKDREFMQFLYRLAKQYRDETIETLEEHQQEQAGIEVFLFCWWVEEQLNKGGSYDL